MLIFVTNIYKKYFLGDKLRECSQSLSLVTVCILPYSFSRCNHFGEVYVLLCNSYIPILSNVNALESIPAGGYFQGAEVCEGGEYRNYTTRPRAHVGYRGLVKTKNINIKLGQIYNTFGFPPVTCVENFCKFFLTCGV